MSYDKWRAAMVALLSIFLIACSEDLAPSSSDKRTSVEVGSIGHQAGQIASDFSASDTEGNMVNLSDELASHDAVLLYFTMWCPICDSHMSSIRESIKPNYPNIRILHIDYVSGSVDQARASQVSSGYRSETILADPDHELTNQFKGDMGVTVVISSSSEVLMNEGFKYSKLLDALELASQP